MHVPATLPLAGFLTGNLPNPGLSAEAYLSARVFAPRIPRVPVLQAGTNVTLLPNALGDIISVPTVTVADAGGDTTTWPMIATSQTGNMTVATDGDLTYNAATGALTAVTFNGAFIGAATLVTVADESADTTCFPLFVTAATGDLGPKTNAALAFDSATGSLTVGAAGSSQGFTGAELYLTGANGVTSTQLGAINETNTAVDAAAVIYAQVGGTTTTGDPQFRLDIPGGTSWYMGADNDDSDKFKIGPGVSVGVGPAMVIDTSLDVEFISTVTATEFIGPLTGNVTGDVSGNAGTVTVADAAADTTTWPLVAVNQTGSESPRTDAGLTYNANTNALTTTTFVGALTGNADTATTAGSATTATDATNATNIGVTDAGADTSTWILVATAQTGTQGARTDAGLTYNASTNAVTATTFVGALTGNADTATTATNATNIAVSDSGADTTTWVLLAGSQTGTQGALSDAGLTYNANTNALTATTFIGALTGSASGNAGTVTVANEATDTSCFILFGTAATGSLEPKTNADLTYNSSTDQMGVATINLTGGQLTFPATQSASTDVNTLDDYEEGSWTPTLTFATPGTLNVVYSVRVGGYIKIGKLVTATCFITTSTFTLGTATGALQVTGFPFASQNTTNLRAFCGVSWQGITKANYTDMSTNMSENTSLVTFLMSGSAQNIAQLTQADTPSGGTVSLRFTLSYRAAA